MATEFRIGIIGMTDLVGAWLAASKVSAYHAYCDRCAILTPRRAGERLAPQVCRTCGFESDPAELEPIATQYVGRGYRAYTLENDASSEICIVKSRYYTLARRASPCLQFGCTLNTPDYELGDKAYCFNHDWFDTGVAPYRVFRVCDDVEVRAPRESGLF